MNMMRIVFNTLERVDKSMRPLWNPAGRGAALFVVALLFATFLAFPQKAAADEITLTPNAAGTLTGCTWSGAPANYTNLGDDLDTTTASCTAASTDVVTVNLTNTGLAANYMIKQVTINILGYGAAGKVYSIYSENLPGGPYTGSAISLAIAPAASYSHTIVNPGGANNFTPAAVDGMTAGIDAGDNADKWLEELDVTVEYYAQGVDAYIDLSSNSVSPATDLLLGKIQMNGVAGNASNGYTLSSTAVKVTGTISSVGNIKVWWNTADTFSGATLIGTQNSPTVGTLYNVGLSSGGTDKGYLFYTISIPSQALGTYSIEISDVKANAGAYIINAGSAGDRIGLPKTTRVRSVIPPTQTLDDWKDRAKNFNLNGSAPVTKQQLVKIETYKTTEGKPLTNVNMAVMGTLSPAPSKVEVWWKAGSDDFATAVLVGSKTSGFPANGTNFDIALSSTGLSYGWLYFTIDLPATAKGSYAFKVNSISGNSEDNIPLPQTTSYTFITNPYAIQVCGDCHAYPVKDGTRSGTTGAVQGTHSTHSRFNPMKCRVCHKDTTSGETNMAHRDVRIQLRSKLGAAGTYAGYSAWDQTNSPTMRQCQNLACHNNVNANWGSGTTITCNKCHMTSVASPGDVDDFTFDIFTSSAVPKLYSTEWVSRGHGKQTGTYAYSLNPAANRTCTHCHDDGVPHGDPVKPYKTKWTGNQDNFCLNCHGSGSQLVGAFGVRTGMKTHSRPVFVEAGYENLTTWRIQTIKCLDCHDPHGDDNNGMMHKKVWTGGSDAKGRPAAYFNGYSTVKFLKYTGTNGMGKGDETTKTMVCEVCHSRTAYHKQQGQGIAHFNGQKCPDCHLHKLGWAPQKECTACHAIARSYVYNTRQITGTGGDFVRLSRHVSDGSANEIVTDYDCILCHREGSYTKANAGTGFTDQAWHNDNATSTTRMVHLRDVDARDTGWTYNKNTVNDAMRTALDNFCLNCHDSDGASNIAVNSTATGLTVTGTPVARNLTPFNPSDNLKNGRDNFSTRTRVVDVKSQFYEGSGGSGAGYNGNPSQHAVLGKRYSTKFTNWAATTWTAQVYGNTSTANLVRETARLHCSDCHLSEQNAHGAANAWHMLKNGNAGENFDTVMSAQVDTVFSSVVCYRCHNSNFYKNIAQTGTPGTRWSHDDDGNVWGKSYGNTLADKGAKLGPTCLQCHSGRGFGHIHGRGAATDGDNGTYSTAAGTYNKYRFMPGAYMYFKPGDGGTDADWAAAGPGNPTCYFPGGQAAWSACSQHSGDKDGAGTINYGRAVKY